MVSRALCNLLWSYQCVVAAFVSRYTLITPKRAQVHTQQALHTDNYTLQSLEKSVLQVDAIAVCSGHYTKPFCENKSALAGAHRGLVPVRQSVYECQPYQGLHRSSVYLADPPQMNVVEFPGRIMHSHNYRVPEPFAGQTVVIVGAGNSAIDISRELANVVGPCAVHCFPRKGTTICV